MKNKITSLFVLALFLLSIISVIADLEVPEDQTEEEPTEEVPCDPEMEECEVPPQEENPCDAVQEEPVDEETPVEEDEEFVPTEETEEEIPVEEEPTEEVEEPCVTEEVASSAPQKRGGHGGLYIAKGKTWFDMTSQHNGKGFGVIVGQFYEGKKVRMYFPMMKLELTGLQKGQRFNGFHIKELRRENKNDLRGLNYHRIMAEYEWLSNMNQDAVVIAEFRVASGEDVIFTLDGTQLPSVKLPSKSKSQDLYKVLLPHSGVLRIVKK